MRRPPLPCSLPCGHPIDIPLVDGHTTWRILFITSIPLVYRATPDVLTLGSLGTLRCALWPQKRLVSFGSANPYNTGTVYTPTLYSPCSSDSLASQLLHRPVDQAGAQTYLPRNHQHLAVLYLTICSPRSVAIAPKKRLAVTCNV